MPEGRLRGRLRNEACQLLNSRGSEMQSEWLSVHFLLNLWRSLQASISGVSELLTDVTEIPKGSWSEPYQYTWRWLSRLPRPAFCRAAPLLRNPTPFVETSRRQRPSAPGLGSHGYACVGRSRSYLRSGSSKTFLGSTSCKPGRDSLISR